MQFQRVRKNEVVKGKSELIGGDEKLATIFERLKRIIVDQLGVDEAQVVPSTSFAKDLNVDSSEFAELIMAIEEEFSDSGRKLEIPDEDVERITIVQAAIDYLRDCGIED